MGNKDDETVANPCGMKIDKRKQAVYIKTTGKVSPSERMASGGRYIAACRVRVESDFCPRLTTRREKFCFRVFWVLGIQQSQ